VTGALIADAGISIAVCAALCGLGFLIRRGAATKTSSNRFQLYAVASTPRDALLTEAVR
jgi:hypothetical protein